MSDATQTQTLEQTLNRTDLGHTLYENRKLIIALLIGILVAVVGYSLYKQNKTSKSLSVAVKVFEFESKTWSGAKDGKVMIPELVKQFEALDDETKSSPVMIPVALEMGKFLADKDALNEAEAVLSKVNATHPVSAFFVGMQRMVVLEKLSKYDEAISVMEKLAKEKDVLMAARVNLELGRLNLLKGDKSKAKTHFDYVLNTYPNDEHAKLAKLYAAKLAE